MRVDIHSIDQIKVDIHKSNWEGTKNGWFSLKFDKKNYWEEEPKEADYETTLFCEDIENAYATLIQNLQRAMEAARVKHAEGVAERKAEAAAEKEKEANA